ncbi:hypothetical protein ACHAXT_004328 [Thalassiosira profunda]
MMPPTMLTAALAAGAVYFSSREAHAFGPPTHIITSLTHHHHATPTATSSALFGKRRKPSMKERRKQRAKKQPSTEVDRGVLNDLPAVDTWEKTEPTAGTKRLAAAEEQVEGRGEDDEAEETAAKASSLVESQRKSVDCLTFIRKRVEETSFPAREAARAVADQGYFVYDGFLSSGDDEDAAFGDVLLSDMMQEGADMLASDKLERDIARLGDGEYTARIIGGEEYANCPRLTEYVVSLTRHLPPLLNKELDALGAADIARLDATASMGALRLYDRKARLGAQALVATPETGDDDYGGRPFGVVCGDSEGGEGDARRLTAMFFLSSKEWDAACSGGITLEVGEKKIDAVRDRIVLLRSDTCSHRQDPWKGSDEPGLEQAGCVVVHFVKEAAT